MNITYLDIFDVYAFSFAFLTNIVDRLEKLLLLAYKLFVKLQLSPQKQTKTIKSNIFFHL